MNINDAIFFSEYRNQFGSLGQAVVGNLNELLPLLKADTLVHKLSYYAYIMGTIHHETGTKTGRYAPIHEIGSKEYFERRYGADTRVGKVLGNTEPGDGARFHGRGYVQTTGRRNYTLLTTKWNELHPDEQKISFVDNPELLLVPRYSWFATTYGMTTGLYTGKKLSDYGDPTGISQFKPMRRIINGLDKADLIAGYAVKWYEVLRKAVTV